MRGHLPVTEWVSGGGDGQGSGFPRASILPELFDGRECSGEARGSRMMGGNTNSHECNFLEPCDPSGISLITPKGPFPKGIGCGNPPLQ